MPSALDIGFGQGSPTLQASRGLFSAPSIGATLSSAAGPGPAPGQIIKWNPTIYAMSVANPPSGVLANYQNEINVYAASLAANPGLFSIVGGYTMYVGWNIVQSSSNGQQGVWDFSVIDATFNYLQQKVPGASMVVQFTCYSNWLSPYDASAGRNILPAYVYNGGTATYGHPSGTTSSPGNGAGWGLISYNSPAAGDYGFVIAALWNPNTSAEYQKMISAYYQHVFTPQYGPLAGKSSSVLANPLIEAVLDYSPSEFANFTNSPTTPSDFSGAGYINNWNARTNAIRAGAPGMLYGPMFEYLSTGMQMSDLEAMIANNTAKGAAFSCTDVFWSGTAIDPTYGQNIFVGNVQNSQGVWVPGGPVSKGVVSCFPTVQPEDYERTGGGASKTPNTVAQVTNILTQNCYAFQGADHVCMAMSSETAAGSNPSFSLKDWYDTTKTGTAGNGFIVNGILAAGGIPTANQALPSAYA